MSGDDDRPSDRPPDACWPPEEVRSPDDVCPDLGARGPSPPPAARAAAWSLTLLGPLGGWALGFWLAGLGQDDVRPAECVGLCLTAREEVWFAGAVYGLVAVPVATGAGAVAVALVAPIRRLGAAVGVLVADVLVVLLAAAALAEGRPG